MKTSLDHLPREKRDQIAAIAAILREGAPVDLIILFGSYARGDWVEDRSTRYYSDYDFMVVVETPAIPNDLALWTRLETQTRELSGHVPLTLLVHDLKHINREIRTGQYFFADVVNEGVLLYDSRRVQLARPKA